MLRLIVIGILTLLIVSVQGQQSHQTVTLVEGSSVTLNANASDAVSFLWFKDGVQIPNEIKGSILVNTGGIYTVIALGNSCDSDLSDPVEVILTNNPGPKLVDMQIRNLPDRSAVFIGQPITYQIIVNNKGDQRASQVTATIQLPKEVIYDQVTGIYAGEIKYDASKHEITWTLNRMEIGQTETISITVISKEPGQADQLALVTSLESDSKPTDNQANSTVQIIALHIPNVFTPNGDGINDTFEIKGIQFLPTNKITIFNINGNEVYKSSPYKNDWNGSGLNNGTYYYIVEILMPNGQWELFKGYVTLLR